MSGFNPATGWTHFTPTKVSRYASAVPGQPDTIEGRLEGLDLRYFWDAHAGLHVECTGGELWSILSGRPDTMFNDQVADDDREAEWISVTDLGAVWNPPLATGTVNKLLREEGLLERVERRDVPTAAAAGLFHEREAIPASGFHSKPGAMQRLWSYEVVLRLRGRHDEVEAERAAKAEKAAPKSPPNPKLVPFKVKFDGACTRCQAPLAAGEDATWDPDARKLVCIDCAEVPG